MRESIPGFFCDGLTKITLITNTDGVHTTEEVIGYVAEQDFCILSDMINQYYISKYNDIELFPANFFSGKYTIGIYNLGSRYDLDNFVKSYYPDMPRFIYNHKILERAEIDNDDIDMVKEYATFLNNRADEIESIKEAIEYKKKHNICRIKLNYVVIKNINDSKSDIDKMVEYLEPVKKDITIKLSFLNYTQKCKENNLFSPNVNKMKNILETIKSKGFDCYLFGTENNTELGCGQLVQNNISKN